MILGSDLEADAVAMQNWAKAVKVAVDAGEDDLPVIRVTLPIDGLDDAQVAERAAELGKLMLLVADWYQLETGDELEIKRVFDVRLPEGER